MKTKNMGKSPKNSGREREDRMPYHKKYHDASFENGVHAPEKKPQPSPESGRACYIAAAFLIFACVMSPAASGAKRETAGGASTDTINGAGQKDYTLQDIESKTDSEKIKYYIKMGDGYLDKNDYIAAIESYNEAIAIKDNNPDILLKLGETYRRAEMREEAVNSYFRALKCKCDDTKVFLGMGLVFKSELLYEKSEVYFTNALDKAKNNPVAVNALAEIYAEEGRYAESINMYKKLLTGSSGSAVKDRLALLCVLSGDYVEAGKYFTATPVSSVLRSYTGIAGGGTPDGEADETFIRGISAMRREDMPYAKKCFETLAGMKEDSLAKKLAAALYDGPR